MIKVRYCFAFEEMKCTNTAFHNLALLYASRMGGEHLKRVSPFGISSDEKAK